MSEEERYLFVIDTDTYSGNFEREMCAYLTGQVGDCGVGEDGAEEYGAEVGATAPDMDELVCSRADEHGCVRPVVVWPTPGWWNDGDGQHTRGPAPTDSYPAYQSVGICLSRRPTDDEVAFLKGRARGFLQSRWARNHVGSAPVAISGFRLVTETSAERAEAI